MMRALHAGAAFLCAGGGTGQYDVKRRDLTASAIRATTAPQDWDAPGKGPSAAGRADNRMLVHGHFRSRT